jgi:hypothetical protein
LETGWALSVAVASARSLPATGRTRSRSCRPTPIACSSGSTNSMDRNHCDPRTQADTNATIRSPSGASPGAADGSERTATRNRSGSVAWRWRKRAVIPFGSNGQSRWFRRPR